MLNRFFHNPTQYNDPNLKMTHTFVPRGNLQIFNKYDYVMLIEIMFGNFYKYLTKKNHILFICFKKMDRIMFERVN